MYRYLTLFTLVQLIIIGRAAQLSATQWTSPATWETRPDRRSDPDGYMTWKEEWNLRARGMPSIDAGFRRPDEILDLSQGNGYVNVQIDQMSGEFTEGGKPDGTGNIPSTPDNCSNYWYLMYAYSYTPSTSWIMFKVDGFIEDRTASGGALGNANNVWKTGDTLFAEWTNYHGVRIRLHLHTVRLGELPGQNEQVLFKVTAWPADGGCHQFGCVQLYDTELGCCGAPDCYDGAPISTSIGWVTSSAKFDVSNMPSYWQAYLRNPPPGASYMDALGILSGFEAFPPDVFWYGPWPSAVGYPWDDGAWGIGLGFSNDTATLLKWGQRRVCPGDSLVFATYYGIGDIDAMTGISIRHTPPLLRENCYRILPNPATLTFIVSNFDSVSADSVIANLVTDCEGIAIVGTNPQSFGSIASFGGSAVATWQLDIASDATPPCNYSINLSWIGGSQSIDYTLIIPSTGGSYGLIANASPAEICLGGFSNLTASVSGGIPPYTYNWSPFLGLSSTTGQSVTASPMTTTIYTVTVSDSLGCVQTADDTLTVIPRPIITVQGDTVCGGGAGTLLASGGSEGSVYIWQPGGIVGQNLTTSVPGVYYVICYDPICGAIGPVSGELVSGTGPDTTYSQRLVRGWNMLSMPVEPAFGTHISTIYSATLSSIYAYDPRIPGYFVLDTSRVGLGYWVLVGDSGHIEVVGNLIECGIDSLFEGWNLVGLTDGAPLAVGDPRMRIDPPGAVDFSGVPVYQYYSGYSRADTLFPGRGYWIFAFSSATMEIAP